MKLPCNYIAGIKFMSPNGKIASHSKIIELIISAWKLQSFFLTTRQSPCLTDGERFHAHAVSDLILYEVVEGLGGTIQNVQFDHGVMASCDIVFQDDSKLSWPPQDQM